MIDSFDIEKFLEQYIKNIRQMQQLTDDQIREVMLQKIDRNPEYFEIISDVSQKVDNKKFIRKVLGDHQIQQDVSPEPDRFSGRKIA